MKHFTTVSLCCVALAALAVHAQVHAQPGAAKEVTGPYIGLALGAAFGNREIDDSNSSMCSTTTCRFRSSWKATERSPVKSKATR